MFPHARKGHVEPLGKGCDRSVRTPELLQNAASGGVRERAERGIEVGLTILNHTVQYNSMGDGMQWDYYPGTDAWACSCRNRRPSLSRQLALGGFAAEPQDVRPLMARSVNASPLDLLFAQSRG